MTLLIDMQLPEENSLSFPGYLSQCNRSSDTFCANTESLVDAKAIENGCPIFQNSILLYTVAPQYETSNDVKISICPILGLANVRGCHGREAVAQCCSG